MRSRKNRKSQFPGSRSAISGRRYYNPNLGRFLGRDPAQEKGGLHLYAFCENNGVNRYDFLGMDGSGPSWTDQVLESEGIDPSQNIDQQTLLNNEAENAQMRGKYGLYNSGGGGGGGADVILGSSGVAFNSGTVETSDGGTTDTTTYYNDGSSSTTTATTIDDGSSNPIADNLGIGTNYEYVNGQVGIGTSSGTDFSANTSMPANLLGNLQVNSPTSTGAMPSSATPAPAGSGYVGQNSPNSCGVAAAWNLLVATNGTRVINQNNQVAFDNLTASVEAAGGSTDSQIASMYNTFAQNAGLPGGAVAILSTDPDTLASSAIAADNPFIGTVSSGDGGSHAVTYIPSSVSTNVQVISSAYDPIDQVPQVFTYSSPADMVGTGLSQAGGAKSSGGNTYYMIVVIR